MLFAGIAWALLQTGCWVSGPSDSGPKPPDDSGRETAVQYTAPAVSEVVISPTSAYTNDTLTASATVVDADGDSLTVTYDWYVDSTLAQSGTSATLSGAAAFDKDEVVGVSVTADDGTESASASSSPLIISNSAPTAPVVFIVPEEPEADIDDLICLIDTDSTDDDGDSITYSIEWDVDGTIWTGGTSTTHEANDTIARGDIGGEEWTCTVTPHDGDEDGTPGTTSVTIATDVDDDGYPAHEDCDDTDARLFPYDSDGDGSEDACGWRDSDGGFYHGCALDSSGNPVCWGLGGSGSVSAAPSGSFVAIGTGAKHNCVIDTTGSIQCWGLNDFGQSNAPSGTFVAISSLLWHNCAVDSTGSIQCWGYDGSTEEWGCIAEAFGDPPPGSFTDVSTGYCHTCALNSSGGIECWGQDAGGQVSDAPSGTFVAVESAAFTTCAIDLSGTIECWGGVDSYGEISDAPTGTGYTDVSGGEGHHCAINPTQGIECWGRDNYNEVNQTPTTGTFTDLEAGGYHTCAIDTSGGITCWGYIHGTSGAP